MKPSSFSPSLSCSPNGEMTSLQVCPSYSPVRLGFGLLSKPGALLLPLPQRAPEPSLRTAQTWELVGTKDNSYQCLGGNEQVNSHPSEAEANLGLLEAARLERFTSPPLTALVPSRASVGSRTGSQCRLVHRLQGGVECVPAAHRWHLS